MSVYLFLVQKGLKDEIKNLNLDEMYELWMHCMNDSGFEWTEGEGEKAKTYNSPIFFNKL